ncbi:unnamed protein product [Acanthoscelides obtectus]|uniref:TPX2 central domain-containing protein n=1 Tax=Acanthoscelides obtectus TaxID=200917 RepID=A0A9P0JT98_ACAOB|nr:unnamed protein product [Acanthoscelides obtectus]CAK1637367.1 Targeting protein for Xklp2 homolog [Acanthoscelides obtectus]
MDEFDNIKAPMFYNFTVTDDSDSCFDELNDTSDPLDATDEQDQCESYYYTPGKEMRRSMSQGDVQFLEGALQGLLIYRNKPENGNDIKEPESENGRKEAESENDRKGPEYENVRNEPEYENDRNEPEYENDRNEPEYEKERNGEQTNKTGVKDCLKNQPKKNMNSARVGRSQLKQKAVRHTTASLDRLQALSKPKYTPNHPGRDYVPVAEMISKIGGRFRDCPDFIKMKGGKLKKTDPHTPKLLTTGRNRPAHIESAAQKEDKEVAEMQKFKFKAKPVNEKIIHGPVKALPLEKKPTTVPEPFHLTEVKHKPIEEPKMPEFHAKPVPKSVLEGPKKIEVHPKLTIPNTPQFMRKYLREHPTRKPSTCSQENAPKGRPTTPYHKRRTEPVPFSFEVRDKMLKRKKDKMIEEANEEFKKGREFRARPMPKVIVDDNRKGLIRSSKSLKSSSESLETGNAPSTFRARPATVLKQAPFVPKKASFEEKVTRPFDFQLCTDKRAAEREEFERKQKEKEEVRERMKREGEERRRKVPFLAKCGKHHFTRFCVF